MSTYHLVFTEDESLLVGQRYVAGFIDEIGMTNEQLTDEDVPVFLVYTLNNTSEITMLMLQGKVQEISAYHIDRTVRDRLHDCYE